MIETGQLFEIAVTGSGEEEGMPEFDAWRLEIGALAEILEAIDEQIHSKATITWRLADLHHSTPTIALRPEWNTELASRPVDAVMALWFSAVSDLRNGKDPEALGARALDAVRKALRPIGNGLRLVDFSYGERADALDVQISAALSNIKFKTEVAEEDWEGSLDELNLHNETNTFRLYPAVSRRWITCDFTPEQEALVRDNLQHKVSVTGEAVYRPKEMLPHRIRVKSIERLDDDVEPLDKFAQHYSVDETSEIFERLSEHRNGWQ
ncbi:hypothetical protein FHS91_001076 [Sphingobium xanthum]|uniref:hypothetical protein n=1 Tax=Sphingobium xanthum TaxID=1387165 RepID=UPI001C8B4C5D|nr:hypothetical protein [Sphingobium xanthum]